MIRKTAVVALGVFALAAGPAHAATPKKNTITAIGGMKLKANEFITDDQRWDANVYEIKSGATVTLRDKSEDNQPHSLSLIKKTPKTPAQIMGCEACGPLMAAHEANPETGAVGKQVVEAGRRGLRHRRRQDRRGRLDLPAAEGQGVLQGDRGQGQHAELRLRRASWMLGKIKVK